MKQEDISPEEAMKQIQKIFKKRGTKALKMARKEILEEKIECKEAREALKYFITQYWHDLARPSLLSFVCEAVGGEPEFTTSIAVPMVLISGAIDVHDDIIDQSKTKEKCPTVYGKFGKDMALLVGDALLFKGLTALNAVTQKNLYSREKTTVAIDVIQKMFFELGDAEASEMELRGRIDVSPEEYLRIVRKKAADVEALTQIGAIFGGASQREVKKLGRYGRLLGTLMILRDDWIDVMDLTELQHRIKKESLPLPVLYALLTPEIKLEIINIFKKKMFTKKDAETILEISQKAGGFKHTEKLMNELVKEADKCLSGIKINRKYLRLMLQATLPDS